MNAYHLLQILKDARDEGLWREQSLIVEELAADVAYRGRPLVGPNRPYRPRRREPDVFDRYDDEDTDETIEEFRARIGALYRQWQATDWMAWQEEPKSTTSLVDDIFKRYYTDQAVADLANRDHAAFSSGMAMREYRDQQTERFRRMDSLYDEVRGEDEK